MKRSYAALSAVLLTGLAYGAVVALTERPVWDKGLPSTGEGRAALAIRDNVTPFQKWGSKAFTGPYLDRYYRSASYFTQTSSDDQKRAFLARLDEALAEHEAVDLFLLAHNNKYVDWVEELSPERRRRLRLVYNTGCRDLTQGPRWLGLGARAYVGHPGASASPVFYFYFLRRWARGHTIREALAESNELMRAALGRAEALSLGKLDAGRAYEESEAFCFGDDQLQIQGTAP